MTATDTFLSKWADIAAVGSAAAVLSWDQETKMPPKGHASRGHALSVLAGIHHDKLTDPALADAIQEARTTAGGDATLLAQLREAERDVTRASAVPGDLARKMAETQSRALGVWQQAKADADFAPFEPVLAEVIDLTKEQAAALVDAGIASKPYDALLDGYEPGATEAELAPLLGDLRDELTPLVKAVADSGVVIDESPATGEFAEADQRAFGTMVASAIGYDFEAGRLDESAHPFTTGFGNGDVRITGGRSPTTSALACSGSCTRPATPCTSRACRPTWRARRSVKPCRSASTRASRACGRTRWAARRAFWEWAMPKFQEQFPSKSDVTVSSMHKALHTVTPSFIRVEADEGTYNLHIVARFDIERQIIGGDVAVRDLPELWASTYQDLLGVRPESVADGVLQDIHWAMGGIGYFPTYTLGNLVAAQLFDAATDAIDDLPGKIAAGDFAPLLDWLRENVHRHGRMLTADEIVQQATGRPLSSEPFLTYLRTTTEEVYGL